MTQDSKGGWVDYKPGDPVPSLRVRVRFLCGLEAPGIWSADLWDWEETGPYQIVAYLPGAEREETEAERLARAALEAAGVKP